MMRNLIFPLLIALSVPANSFAGQNTSLCVTVGYASSHKLQACLPSQEELIRQFEHEWVDDQVQQLKRHFMDLLAPKISVLADLKKKNPDLDMDSHKIYRILSDGYRSIIENLYIKLLKDTFLDQYQLYAESGMYPELNEVNHFLFHKVAYSAEEEEPEDSLLIAIAKPLTDKLLKQLSIEVSKELDKKIKHDYP